MDIVHRSIIIPFFQDSVKKKACPYNICIPDVRMDTGDLPYFLRKDLQSVHWSMVGFISWVPTRILFREQ